MGQLPSRFDVMHTVYIWIESGVVGHELVCVLWVVVVICVGCYLPLLFVEGLICWICCAKL